jgi:hypothetical protein
MLETPTRRRRCGEDCHAAFARVVVGEDRSDLGLGVGTVRRTGLTSAKNLLKTVATSSID